MNRIFQTRSSVDKPLAQAFSSGKMPHAFLIAGPEGSGKKTLARRIAAAFVCEQRRFPPCGVCTPCHQAAHGEHGDVYMLSHQIERDSGEYRVVSIVEGRTYEIKNVRELINLLQLHSMEEWKVAILPDIDRLMREDSQNAFLKTLEEPTANTALILTCVNLQRVLPTIISRCQLLRLPPMPRETIRELVRQRGIDDDEAALIAEFASGNAIKAMELDLEFVLGFRRQLLEKMVAIEPHDRIGMLDFAETLSKVDHPQDAVLDLVAGFYDDVLCLKLGRDDIRNRDLRELAAREASRQTVPGIVDKIETVLSARRRALGNARPQINWEILIMTLKGVEGAAITRA